VRLASDSPGLEHWDDSSREFSSMMLAGTRRRRSDVGSPVRMPVLVGKD
jgi:hypothetical protein